MACSLVLSSALLAAVPEAAAVRAAPVRATAETTPSSSPSAAAEPEPPLDLDAKRLLAYGLLRAGGRFVHGDPGVGGSMHFGVGVRIVRGLYIQGEVGEGLYANPGHAIGTVLGGLRYEIRRWDRVRPSAFLGFTHAHRSHLDDLASAPLATLVGSADTIRHRSGLQVDLALRLPFPTRWGRPLSRVSGLLRADLGYYFDHAGTPLHLGLGGGLSVTF